VHYCYQHSTPEKVSFGGPGEISVEGSSIQRLPTGAYRVQAKGKDANDQSVEVDLTFTPAAPGFKLGDGTVRFDGQVALAWVVPMPRASVEGTVKVGDQTRTVRGLGYHDHNWGDLNLRDTMAYWYWGRVSSPDSTVIYADVHFRPELGARTFSFVVAGDGSHMSRAVVDPTFQPVESRFLDGAGREVPKGLAIRGDAFAMDLAEEKVLEADPGLRGHHRVHVRRSAVTRTPNHLRGNSRAGHREPGANKHHHSKAVHERGLHRLAQSLGGLGGQSFGDRHAAKLGLVMLDRASGLDRQG
jgi:hypothetical protein